MQCPAVKNGRVRPGMLFLAANKKPEESIMRFADLSVGRKLGGGFAAMLLLIGLLMVAGLNGIGQVAHSLFVVGDEAAPRVDAANEMKLALMTARNNLEEFKGASAVLASNDEASLGPIEEAYQQTLAEFDTYVDAILEGATLEDGTVVLKTDDARVADLVRRSDEVHNSKFQKAAAEMMQSGRAAIKAKQEANASMETMEQAYEAVVVLSDRVETAVKERIEAGRQTADSTYAWKLLLERLVPLVDAAMELKVVIDGSRMALEEVAQASDKQSVVVLQAEYQATISEFDEIVEAVLNGGVVDGTQAYKAEDPDVRQAVEALDQTHANFQDAATVVIAKRLNMIDLMDQANAAMERLDAAGDEADQLLKEVEQVIGGKMSTAKQEAGDSHNAAIGMMVGVGLFSVLLGIVLGVLITRAVTRPLNQARAVSERIAAGDLATEIMVQSKDETGQLMQSMKDMQGKLSEVIEQDIQAIVDAALDGDLSARIALDGKQGFFAKLSSSINELVDINERVIGDTERVMGALARGDLTQTIDADYRGAFGKLKSDANQTVEKLTEVVGRIKESSYTVNTAANEIAEGNTNLSQRTEEQASSLEETASSMEEMTSAVRQNADTARAANQLSISAREQAEKGGQVISKSVSAMSEISAASKKIADIIGVIDEIAFQTNLLALNASVEAARAGEQGRGFAVVASEVRNLAGRSATAAKEIKALIEDSMGKVEEGARLVDESGATLNEIVSAVKKVTDNVGEISAATQEQSSGIEQVNKAVTQMDEMTQQNAALVEQAMAAAQSLSEQAGELSRMMEFFRMGEGAGAPAPAAVKVVSPRPATKVQKKVAGAELRKPSVNKVTEVKDANDDDDEWEEF